MRGITSSIPALPHHLCQTKGQGDIHGKFTNEVFYPFHRPLIAKELALDFQILTLTFELTSDITLADAAAFTLAVYLESIPA
jgi:hypothetical protein